MPDVTGNAKASANQVNQGKMSASRAPAAAAKVMSSQYAGARPMKAARAPHAKTAAERI
jgi:hypothetical protein